MDVGVACQFMYIYMCGLSLYFVLAKEDGFFFVQMECYMFFVTEINILPFDNGFLFVGNVDIEME